MPYCRPIITRSDYDQLNGILHNGATPWIAAPQALAVLEDCLRTALIVAEHRVPSTIVTMNSRVQLGISLGQAEDAFNLVFPKEANIAEGKLSVSAPVGAAILGRHVGQTVGCLIPSGELSITIGAILFQPQAERSLSGPRTQGWR